jgi:two-component system cell cycle response regulator
MPRDERHSPAIIDRRGLLGFSAGLAGLGFGLGSAVLDLSVLGLVAGACSFVSALTIVRGPRHDANQTTMGRTEKASSQIVAVAPARADLADDRTPLLPGDYFDIAGKSRVMAARRFLKPLAVIRLRITDDRGNGLTGNPEVADLFANTLRECDTACILSDSEIGLVLEDTPENGAVWVVERLRRAMPESLACRMRAGVACYPAHAMDAPELLEQVDTALERAAEWSQDRIEVALSE